MLVDLLISELSMPCQIDGQINLYYFQHLQLYYTKYYSRIQKIMPSKYKLIYFNARGRAEHIRFIFAYAGIEYDDERIPREKWPELKKSKSSSRPMLCCFINDWRCHFPDKNEDKCRLQPCDVSCYFLNYILIMFDVKNLF